MEGSRSLQLAQVKKIREVREIICYTTSHIISKKDVNGALFLIHVEGNYEEFDLHFGLVVFVLMSGK